MEIPFPGGAADQDVFFHEDKVCVYHASINTWECRTVNTGSSEIGQPSAVTTQSVYTLPIPIVPGTSDIDPDAPDLPDLRNQYDVNWYLANKVDNIPTEIKNNHGLKQVLEAGNIADKNLLLTNAADDLIDLSISEQRIVMGAVGPTAVPKFELRHRDSLSGSSSNSSAAIEIDENGKRLDFETEGAIDNMHFRFSNDDKLILNKTGDAVFSGKVQGVPGTQNNEFVTYGQLLTVEEELEQLAPSLDRGTWEFTLDSEPGVGEYTLVKEKLDVDAQQALCSAELLNCMADSGGNYQAQQECNRKDMDCTNAIVSPLKLVTTNDFSEAIEVIFNATDYYGVEHTFAGIDPDHLLDLFNESDDSYMVGDITSDSGGVFEIDIMTARGTAAGLATLKIFKHEGSVDFDQYVRKQGDTMTGGLRIEGYTEDANPCLYIRPTSSKSNNSDVLKVDSSTSTRLFYITNQGDINTSQTYTPTSDRHVTNKKYVDNYVQEFVSTTINDPARFGWEVTINNPERKPMAKKCNMNGDTISNSQYIYLSLDGYGMNKPIQGATSDGKIMYAQSTVGAGNNAMMLGAWFSSSNDWKWKGSAEVSEVKIYDTYMRIKLRDFQRWDNEAMANGQIYYFTLSGLF